MKRERKKAEKKKKVNNVRKGTRKIGRKYKQQRRKKIYRFKEGK